MLKRLKLRTKITGILVLVAMISGTISYWVPNFFFQPIVQTALPQFGFTNEVTVLSRAIEAEAVSFVAIGEEIYANAVDAQIAELQEVHADLEPYSQENNNFTKGEDFSRLIELSGVVAEQAELTVSSHRQTLVFLSDLAAVEESVEAAFITYDNRIQQLLEGEAVAVDGESDEEIHDEEALLELQLLYQLMGVIRQLQLETLTFVATSDEQTRQQRIETEAALEDIRGELNELLGGSSEEEAFLSEVDVLVNTVLIISEEVSVSHQNTLIQLAELARSKEELLVTIGDVQEKVEQDVEADLQVFALSIFASAVIVLISSIIIGLFSTNVVLIQPINRLVEVARKMGEGDLAVQAESSRQDELGLLGQTFNDMAASLQTNIDGLAQRITELQYTRDELEQANQDLGRFVYIASHDLKSPIRAIAHLAEWIKEDLGETALNDASRQHLALMQKRVRRMESLLDAILEYTQVGRGEAVLEEVVVADLIATTWQGLPPPPDFTLEIQGDIPAVSAVRTEFEAVLFHLLDNAVQHHHSRTGQVTVSAQRQNGFYEFAVADDGPGIDPAYHERIFIFFQTLKARDEKEHAGVGLALVQKIVDNAGGTVRVESSLGEGATFYFTWPV